MVKKRSAFSAELCKKLREVSGNDFNKELITILRILWPGIRQATQSRNLPDAGIDFFVYNQQNHFYCVVSCGGFEQDDYEAAIQYLESKIDQFIHSKFSTQKYIIIHNVSGPNIPIVHQNITNKLGIFDLNNKSEDIPEIWDLKKLVTQVEIRIEEILIKSIHKHSKVRLKHYEELFEFSKCYSYIPIVPVAKSRLVFEEGKPCHLEHISPVNLDNISDLILSPSKARWTLLTGIFGTGKTTAALQSAQSSKKQGRLLIFVECTQLEIDDEIGRTNKLLEKIIESLDIVSKPKVDSEALFYQWAAPILAHLLRNNESQHIFILDGLDEHRLYSTQKGIECLHNSIKDFRCDKILITRKEHLSSQLGNFNTAFSGLSIKEGKQQSVRLLELVLWEKKQVIQFVSNLITEVRSYPREKLKDFLNLLENEGYTEYYGDLPLHPLFLQFILEDIVEDKIQKSNRADLLHRWFRRKVERDVKNKSKRIPINLYNEFEDFEDTFAQVVYLMEDIANFATVKNGEKYELKEFIWSNQLEVRAKKLFKVPSVPIISILLRSVLVPQSLRRGEEQKIIFALRVFHEYFLASYLARRHLPCVGYPPNVNSLYSEITLRIDSRIDPELAAYVVEEQKSYNENVFIHTLQMSQPNNPSFSGASIGAVNMDSTVFGDQIGTQHNYAQEKTLDEATKEIQELLEQLANSNLTTTEALPVIEQRIKNNPTLKQRFRSALKAGLTEAVKAAFNHPAIHIPFEAVRGFIEVD